jgi:hypothetical protein
MNDPWSRVQFVPLLYVIDDDDNPSLSLPYKEIFMMNTTQNIEHAHARQPNVATIAAAMPKKLPSKGASQSSKDAKKLSVTYTTVPIRISHGTRKLLQDIMDKANEKELGRRIKVDEVIAKGLSLICSDHISELIDNSLTNSDRVELLYMQYAKNKNISKDAFLGKLLRGELQHLPGSAGQLAKN